MDGSVCTEDFALFFLFWSRARAEIDSDGTESAGPSTSGLSLILRPQLDLYNKACNIYQSIPTVFEKAAISSTQNLVIHQQEPMAINSVSWAFLGRTAA
ncbi:hypothetical protein BDV36DRAFT_259754 [Aspergillus pseudocaelatus]|uniref:Uncharacterized protein n=1 Tax=Aspergillus pseudocaelatus TaxID=1825620 RepID=A0ABQ6WHF9_9EURO|nr:hypothetical protein BDV36DRAFT_259754 [Aspergillus pseudocaelatus]